MSLAGATEGYALLTEGYGGQTRYAAIRRVKLSVKVVLRKGGRKKGEALRSSIPEDERRRV
jgi:hypothetical protein